MSAILYSHRFWFPRHRAATGDSHLFLELYNKLAFKTMYVYNATGFGMKNEFHLICHAKAELENLLVQESPIMWIPSPAMCEDVEKFSRLSRRVSPKTPSRRTLEHAGTIPHEVQGCSQTLLENTEKKQLFKQRKRPS